MYSKHRIKIKNTYSVNQSLWSNEIICTRYRKFMFWGYLSFSQLCHWRLASSVILHRVKWWIFTSRDGVISQNTWIFIVRISGFWQQLPLHTLCEFSCATATMQEGFSRRVVYGGKMLINLDLLLFNFMTLFYIHIVLFVRLTFQQWCCVILLSKHYTSEFPIKILRTLQFPRVRHVPLTLSWF